MRELLALGALDPVAGTFVEPLGCVLRALDRAGLRAGDELLVVGAGSNGLLAIAAARARGVRARLDPRAARRSPRGSPSGWAPAPHDDEPVDVAFVTTADGEAIAGAAARARRRRDAVPVRHDEARRGARRRRRAALPARADGLLELVGRAGATCAPRYDLIAAGGVDALAARHAPRRPRRDGARAGPAAPRRGDQGRGRAVRAALLHGPGDLRVEEVAEPDGEVLVTRRGRDRLRDRRQVPASRPPDPRPLPGALRPRDRRRARRHRRARARRRLGRRAAPARRVAPAARSSARRMTWVLGGFAERIAAPAAALHAVPDGLEAAGAAMAEPLAAAVHAVARRRGARRRRGRARRRHDGAHARAAARARRAAT